MYLPIFFFCTTIFAQNFADKDYYLVDSLELKSISSKDQLLIKNSLEKFHTAINDSVKVEVVYNIVRSSKDEDIWGKYNEWIVDHIKENKKVINNDALLEITLANQGRYYKIKGDYDKAIKFCLESFELTKKKGKSDKIAKAYDFLGDLYKKNGDFINALAFYNKCLEVHIANGNTKEHAQMLNTIGYLHLNFGMHSKALTYFHESLKLREEIGDKRGVSFCFNNIASVHKKQGRPDVALEYYHKSLKIREELKYEQGLSITYNNIGVVYKDMKELDKALGYYLKSLMIKEKLKDEKGISHVLNNIGTIYNEQGKLDMALVKYKESLEMTTALNDEKWMAITLFNMGNLYLKKKETIKAHNSALKSLQISKKTGHPELIRDVADVLKDIFSTQHNWKRAFEMQELYASMRDSIRNKKTEADATEQRITYEVEKKEQEIKLLSAQNDVLQREKEVQKLKLNKNKIVNAMFLIVGIVAFLLALFFYSVSRKSKVVNKLLQKQDDEKKVMLKEIHHRVKNNLQVVNSLLRLQSKEIKDEEIVAKFRETQKRVITIAALHEKMYRSDNLKHINLREHIESIVEDLVTTYAIEKKIDIELNIEKISIGLRTLVPLGLIINEIIVNALKYAFVDTDKGLIKLQIKQLTKSSFEMVIGDNGVGLKNEEKASGFGAKLINIFAKQLNGTLEYIDSPGTMYKITFERIDPQ
jgi:two-component sensor histidine kinase/tetratricopeptide (TPR) repeat protein